jgi:Flp pilus assembly protein CpaB
VAINELPDDPVYSLEDVVDKYATVDLTVRRPLRAAHVRTVVLEGSDLALAVPAGKVLYAIPIRALSTVANAIRPGSYVDVLISFTIVDVDQDLQLKLPVALEGGDDCLAGCQPTGDQFPSLVSQYTVQNVLVLGVGMWGDEKQGVRIYGPGEEEEPVVEVPVAEEPVEGEEAAAPPQEETQPQTLTEVTVVTLAVTPQDALVLKWAWESNSSVDLALRSASDVETYAQPEAVTLRYMIDRFQITLPPKLPHVPENDFQYSLLKGTDETAPAE